MSDASVAILAADGSTASLATYLTFIILDMRFGWNAVWFLYNLSDQRQEVDFDQIRSLWAEGEVFDLGRCYRAASFCIRGRDKVK